MLKLVLLVTHSSSLQSLHPPLLTSQEVSQACNLANLVTDQPNKQMLGINTLLVVDHQSSIPVWSVVGEDISLQCLHRERILASTAKEKGQRHVTRWKLFFLSQQLCRDIVRNRVADLFGAINVIHCRLTRACL